MIPKLGLVSRHVTVNLPHIKDRVVLRAYETLPESLLHKTVQLEDGSKTDCIIAKQRVQANTLLGPLTAPEGVPPCPAELDLGEHWPVFGDSKYQRKPVARYLAVDDKTMCSWMILVRLAADKQQSNLDLVQHKEQLFFLTSRDIEESEELKYNYSLDYLSKLISELPAAHFPDVLNDLSSNRTIKADESENPTVGEEDSFQKSPQAANAASKMLKTVHRNHVSPQTMCNKHCERTRTPSHRKTFSSRHKDALNLMAQSNDTSDEFPYKVVLVYPPSLNHDMALEYATKPLNYKISSCNNLHGLPEMSDGKAVQVTFSESLPDDIEQTVFLMAISAKHGSSECPQVLYSCTQCKYNRVSFQAVKNHTLLHTEHKLHMCHTCGKCFHHKSALSEHMKCHSSRERNFLCKHCGKGFFSSTRVRKHEKVHTGENRRFPCQGCKKVFTTGNHLQRHFSEVHQKIKKHKCNLCKSNFSQKQALNRHFKSQHPVQSSEQPCGNS